jgi:site-specific recombinase XerD
MDTSPPRLLDQVRAVLRRKHFYGGGLRLMECVRLRVKDLDFAQHQVMVRDGKGVRSPLDRD